MRHQSDGVPSFDAFIAFAQGVCVWRKVCVCECACECVCVCVCVMYVYIIYIHT
jgi:hypothetical protein